jgi:hypothetical protein
VILIGGVIVYEVAARDGELLSEECDRFRTRHPILTYLAISQVALHLLRLLPRNVDLLTWIGRIAVAIAAVKQPVGCRLLHSSGLVRPLLAIEVPE